ncbi:MAG TPA: hypothetical protein VHS96_04720, partial [Bacteroidia bacterium]|nr:hypothetical protein [Bacteroidia bacterium]
MVAWIGIAVATFVTLQFVAAPYGRHVKPGWGPTISNRLGWLLMEMPGLILVPLLFFLGDGEKSAVHYVLVGCYVAHYIHRDLIYPFRTQTQ